MPAGMRAKLAKAMEPAKVLENAAAAASAFNVATDAVLNNAVVAFAEGQGESEKENIVRSAAFAVTVLKTCEQIVMRLAPQGGPREGMHDIMRRAIDEQLPHFERSIRNVLPEGVEVRAKVLAGIIQPGVELGGEVPPPEAPVAPEESTNG